MNACDTCRDTYNVEVGADGVGRMTYDPCPDCTEPLLMHGDETTGDVMSEPKADLAYCERPDGGPYTSPIHVRRVGPEGRRLSGGAPNTVLCGADLGSGWDLQSDVPSTLARWRLVAPGRRPGRICITCADLAASFILATEVVIEPDVDEKTKAPTTRQETR